jgi:Beta-ketoacyl synthase, N-terminal domain
MRGASLAAVGILTGWGEGPNAFPIDAKVASQRRPVISLSPRPRRDDRLRRATRECLLGIDAVEAMLRNAELEREAIAGHRTALVYVTTSAYAASNRAFIEALVPGSTLHFPYTAPSAVPAEVAIEFRLMGSYVILIGAAAATIDALWQASTLIARGAADRALVLAVETFGECADLYGRARWLLGRPLTEAAACALLVAADAKTAYRPLLTSPRCAVPGDRSETEPAPLEEVVRHRAGETLACAPLIALALGRAGGEPLVVQGAWRGRRAALEWSEAVAAAPVDIGADGEGSRSD